MVPDNVTPALVVEICEVTTCEAVIGFPFSVSLINTLVKETPPVVPTTVEPESSLAIISLHREIVNGIKQPPPPAGTA